MAASLRELVVDGVAITETYPEQASTPLGCGIVLVPWANRVADGRWVLDGVDQQLDITEPARNNAIHGLLRNAAYSVLSRGDDTITLAATVFPQHGYPFLLDTTVRYDLLDDGLRVTHTVTNRSAAAAPVALGVHPYFRIGDVPVADLVLTVDADTHFETDARLIPVGQVPTAATGFDLRAGRRVGDLSLDDAFGGLAVVDGVIRHRLTAPDGRSIEVWQQPDWGYVQVFTTREFPSPDGPALAVAIEPMTAPPDALNSGIGLRWLARDEQWSGSWGVSYAH